MNKWFYFNLLLILFVLYKVIFGSHLLVSFIVGLGLLFVLFNWTRHAMFSTIRSDISRIKKIKYVKLSKRVLPIHKRSGMSSFIYYFTNAFFILYFYCLHYCIIYFFCELFCIILFNFSVIF